MRIARWMLLAASTAGLMATAHPAGASCSLDSIEGSVTTDLTLLGQGLGAPLPGVRSHGHAAAVSYFTGNIDYNCFLYLFTGITDLTTHQALGQSSAREYGQVDITFAALATPGDCYEGDAAFGLSSSVLVYVTAPTVCSPVRDKPQPPDQNCPIVLDLDGNGYHLGDVAHAVSFDLDADGTPEELAWTRGGTGDALLARDLDGNGVIDDGRELFGWATRLADGSNAVVGYRALAELDTPAQGGNGDGVVDARDAGFADLLAWVDANHDGISQPGELVPLRETAVVALRYAYTETHRRDGSGNLLRYRSSAWVRRAGSSPRLEATFDVIFAERE